MKFKIGLIIILLLLSKIIFAAEQPISLNFQDISVRSALQILAEFSGKNIIASDTVTGNITLRLENISWDQALDLILQTKGLGKRLIGTVILIAPSAEIANLEKQTLAAQQQIEDLAPLQAELITINYGSAQDIAELLKNQETSLLSSRGSVSADMRTNTLWVEDVPQKLTEIHQLVKKLDVPVKQVLIETKIVNLNCNYEQELGIKFKVGQETNAPNLLGSNNINPQFTMDLPASNLGGVNPATMGLALARLDPKILLDLELSALESEGGGEIISSPRLITNDQQTARIQSGEEIPYQQSTSSGATSVTFKQAVLCLNVTPQITPDHKVMLTLQLNQDKVGARIVHGVPSIDTHEIETQILVDNGATVVLGGIYETDNSKQIQRVPFLSTLPVIGNLFKHKSMNQGRKELLIFVTPHIL